MGKIKILFVCLGNICRSPLAEAVFKHKIREKNLEFKFEVDSCGTSNYHIGDQPDPRTIKNARMNGVEMDHCCRQLTEEDLDHYDHILAMDASNLQNIMKLKNAFKNEDKISLLREYDPDGKGQEVPDPYFGGDQGFQHVFEIVDRTVENLIGHLIKEHAQT